MSKVLALNEIEIVDPQEISNFDENNTTGWISIYRSILNNSHWTSEKFTRGQAWIDMLLLAKNKDGFFYLRDIKIMYKRGYITEGIINLSKRWKWSRGKVKRFLNDLENEHQVKLIENRIITTVKILNYNLYQPKTDKIRTRYGQDADTHNNINKYSYSENEFLEDWKKVREKMDAKPTNLKGLTVSESYEFKKLREKFTREEFREAIQGLFMQTKMFKSTRLRPTHFLSDGNLEKYLDAFKNKTQLYTNESKRL